MNEVTLQTTNPKVFFGGDSAFGPENIIWASAHAHRAAISIHLFCQGQDLIADRPPEGVNLISTKMGVHEWAYDAEHDAASRHIVPLSEEKSALTNIRVEVELGFDQALAEKEAQRCLNCDVQTVFTTFAPWIVFPLLPTKMKRNYASNLQRQRIIQNKTFTFQMYSKPRG